MFDVDKVLEAIDDLPHEVSLEDFMIYLPKDVIERMTCDMTKQKNTDRQVDRFQSIIKGDVDTDEDAA